jgi:predicted DNA-binding transcriptional regulator AlpA
MLDHDPASLLTEAEAAKLLKFTPRFLQARRVRGDGPAYVSVSSRAVRYRRSDLVAWIEERVRTSTSATDRSAP